MTKLFWQEKISIGALSVPRIMSAPLDGITDSPFRRLIRQFSPTELMFGEMTHVNHVTYEKTGKCLHYDEIEQPLAFQFSTNMLKDIDKAVEKVIAAKFIMINLNAGCPAKGIIKSGSGSALMSKVPLLTEIMKTFISCIDKRVPFTLKMRAGFKEKNALEIAQIAQSIGIEAIIIHPRTQPEGFSSRLDFDLVKKIKENTTVPIIFSGNINSAQAAIKTYELTGVDGFMIGRALWGAPWKMQEISQHLQDKTFVPASSIAIQYALKHLILNLESFGPKGFIPLKKQIAQYIRFIPSAAQWREKLLRSQSAEEMQTLLEALEREHISTETQINT